MQILGWIDKSVYTPPYVQVQYLLGADTEFLDEVLERPETFNCMRRRLEPHKFRPSLMVLREKEKSKCSKRRVALFEQYWRQGWDYGRN